MSTPTPISEPNMIRLREVEAELDQQHGLLNLVESEMDRLGDTDAAIEFTRLLRLVAQASAQAQRLMDCVTEACGNEYPKRQAR